jgi:hypothetical protein
MKEFKRYKYLVISYVGIPPTLLCQPMPSECRKLQFTSNSAADPNCPISWLVIYAALLAKPSTSLL